MYRPKACCCFGLSAWVVYLYRCVFGFTCAVSCDSLFKLFLVFFIFNFFFLFAQKYIFSTFVSKLYKRALSLCSTTATATPCRVYIY